MKSNELVIRLRLRLGQSISTEAAKKLLSTPQIFEQLANIVNTSEKSALK